MPRLRSQTLRVPLHCGYREHPQNSPRGPFRFTIGAPHFGHFTLASAVAFRFPLTDERALYVALVGGGAATWATMRPTR